MTKDKDPLYFQKEADKLEQQLVYLRKKHEFFKLDSEIVEFQLKKLAYMKQLAELKSADVKPIKPE